jgi:hypothetical protein
MLFTAIQAAVSKTAAFTGTGVDISGVNNVDYTLVLEIKKLVSSDGSTPSVHFTIEDSVNAFTASIARATFNTKGSFNSDGKQHGQKMTWRKRDLVGLRAGTASAVLRVNVAEISANTTVEYEAYLQRVS